MTDPYDADREDPQLRERLRSADPAASLAPADPDRVARLLEATMEDTAHDTREPNRRGPLTWLVAAAAVLVIGGVALVATLGDGDTDAPTAAEEGPRVTTLAAPAAVDGRCVMPSAEALALQPTAFLGTVEEVADDTVTLSVDDTYAGEEADEVRVEAPSEDLRLLIGAVDFREGEQYLVSATDGTVTVCGFSGPATPRLQSMYDEAFGG